MVTCPNASFTDLAEIVSRIEPVKPAVVDGKTFVCLPRLTFSACRPSLVTVFCHFFNTCSHTMGFFLSSAPSLLQRSRTTTPTTRRRRWRALCLTWSHTASVESTLKGRRQVTRWDTLLRGGDNVKDQSVCPCFLWEKNSPIWGQLFNNPISYA